ncbi:MAG: LLM class F420-dependent oxidoreductase [Candidatus Dormibacteraeota bacterium]|nr:LLM class F420-dependent oxidoreductase [Candidatus Dormibacteraeota bacterium]
MREVVEQVRRMAEAGLSTAACSQIFGYDALTLLALVGAEVPDIELMTAVVPTYPRHPVVLAAQALTVQAATGGRLTLGVGVSHQVVVEGMYGYSYERPARHMREYLEALAPLLRGEPGAYEGETLKAFTMGPLSIAAPPPQLMVAALGPAMLRVTGRHADGTITWMAGLRTVEGHIAPTIRAAAAEAGRPEPRIAVSLPVCVTSQPDRSREQANKILAIYGQLPAYRSMLDRESVDGPGDVAIVGDEDSVARQIKAFAEVGATDYIAALYGSDEDQARTFALLASLARA